MHPVARVSIKYWNNLRTQQSIFLVLDFIVFYFILLFFVFANHLKMATKRGRNM
jgi:hypothetical protein